MVHFSKKLITTGKQAASVFPGNKFILQNYKFVSCDTILVFTFLHGKSLELAARITLLAQLPLNYQLLQTSMAVWLSEW